MTKILVTGATGKLGRLVVDRLLHRNVTTRVLMRRPEEAHRLWGSSVEIATGDFGDGASLKEAVYGVDRVLLLSPITETLAVDQKRVIDAALSSGVTRIVKISGSDWTIQNSSRSISGAAHAQVERHLASSGIQYVILRPNAWMQVALEPIVAALSQGDTVPAQFGEAAVSFIDAGDIADVAAHALIEDQAPQGAFVLTGGEALTALDIAGVAARLLGRPVGSSQPLNSAIPSHLGAFERKAIAEFRELIGEGLAASVEDTVFRIIGREPRRVEDYLRDRLGAATSRRDTKQGEKTWR